MTPDCERFMEDPETHAAHAESCQDCRRFAAEMQSFDEKLAQLSVTERPLAPTVASRLPIAPWEGAAHRAWGPVLIALVVSLAVAAGLMIAAGISPIDWIRSTMSAAGALSRGVVTLLRSAPQIFSDLSPAFRATIIIGFVFVNVIFIRMLRRSPKGYDAR